MERRSTRNCSVRDRERSASLASSRSGSGDVAPKERKRKTTAGDQQESREGSSDTNLSSLTDETDLSSDRSTPLPEDATNRIVVSVAKKTKISEKIIVDALSKKDVTLPSQISEKDATQAMSAFNQKMFGKRKNMKYSSKDILSEKNLFLYFKLKSMKELEEIHLLYEGEEKATIYKDVDHEKNLLDAVNNLKSALKKWKIIGVFVCPKSYYLLMDILERDMVESPVFHRWTDVLSCLRLQEDPNDLKFFSHDPNMLTKISGQSIHPGTESNILANIFDNLNTKDIRECSLKQRKYEFLMFEAEFEKINTDRIIQVHMLGKSNSSLDITVSVDYRKDDKRSLKSRKVVTVDEGSRRIVEFLRAAASEKGSILLINSKGEESIGALLNILCRGKGWSQIREILKGFLNFEDVWKQFTTAELQKSYLENIDKSWQGLIPLRKKIMEHLVGKEGEILQQSHPLYSKWMNQVLEENVRKQDFKIFDPSVHQLLLTKKLHLPKEQVGCVSLELCARYSWLEDPQFSIVPDHPDIEAVGELLTLEDKRGLMTVDMRNTSGADIKLPAKTHFGFAKLKEKSDWTADIDLYLLSSEEEEEAEEGRGEKRKAGADVRTLKRARISLGNSCDTEMITSLEDFKLKLSSDPDAEPESSCITGNTTPEILKTTGTNQFLSDLKESLDKSFDIGDDFDVDEAIQEIDSVESIQALDFRSENEVCRVSSPEAEAEKRSSSSSSSSDYKRISEFSAREVTGDGPLISQLQSLARLLAPVPVPEGLTEHFPSLLSHGDLTALCQTLAKYGIFTKGCLDFELCDFGDKLIYEVANFEGNNLADLKTVMQEFNKSQPRANLELWARLFREKYESFLGINDILGEHFDLKTVQLILLHFAPQFDKQDDDREDPVTSLKYFSAAPEVEVESSTSNPLVCADLDLLRDLREEKILHYFDARQGRENIYLGLTSPGDQKKIMIVKNDQLLRLNLDKECILSERQEEGEEEEEDYYLVHVRDYAGCSLALPLASWDLPGQPLLSTGFLISYSSSQECHIAVIEGQTLRVVVVDPTQMIMLEDNLRLQAGSEVKLIINSNFEPLLCLAQPDGQKYDLHDVSKWSGDSTSFISNVENLPEIQDLVNSLQITRLQARPFLLIKSSDSDKLLKVKQIILKKSIGWGNHPVKNYMHSHSHRQIMPANVLASREDLLDLKFLFLFTNTSVELLNKVIIVEGDSIDNINLVKKSLLFNLKKSKSSNRASARKEFLEIKSGQEISLGEKEKKSFAISIAAEDINLSEYNVLIHFDFECFKNELASTVKIDAENAEKITLELGNVSKRKILISRDQNVLLLERKSSSKVSSKNKHVFSLKLIKTVNMVAKSVSFVECVVVGNFQPMTEKKFKIHRHPDFKNNNIFLPDKQMRTISPSGQVKISLRNKTSSALEVPEGSIIGQIMTKD